MGAWLTSPAAFELGTDGPSILVVGVDGSRTSMHALAYAAGLARRQRSRLLAVHVRSADLALATLDRSGTAVQAVRGAQEQLEAELRAEVQDLARAWQVGIRLMVRDGDPMRQLAAVAAEQHADAIVVGSPARSRHWFAGSGTARLMRHSDRPVTVVP